MLTKSAIAASAPLAQLYANKNIRLEPAGPALAVAVRPLIAPLGAAAEEGLQGGFTDFADLLHTCSRHADEGQHHEHDAVMADLTQKVVGAIRYNLQLARGVVNDQIGQLVSGLDDLSKETEAATVNRLKIVPSMITAATESGFFDEVAQRYSETRAEELKFNVIIPMPEDISVYLSAGHPAHDAAIAETLRELGPETAQQIWQKLFVQGASRLEDMFPINNPRSWAELAIAFVLVKNVQNNLPSGINAPLDTVRNYLVTLAAQIGRMIAVASRRRVTQQKAGRLILETPKHGAGEVVVNSDTYRGYLNQGGTPEAIMGAVSSNESLTSVQDLVQHKDRLERQWNASRRIQQETASANRLAAATSYLRGAISTMIQSVDDETVNAVAGGRRENFNARLDAVLKTVSPRLLENTWFEVRRILCYVLYSHTAVETILISIDREGEHNPDLSPMEAALMAVIDYYVDWIADQIIAVKQG